jgi:aminopeptidase 2
MGCGSTLKDRMKGRKVLPDNVKPSHYKLTLRPNLETYRYTGSVYVE